MIQRSLRTRSLVGLSLVLVAGGLVAAACSSDENPSTNDGQLSPDPNNEAGAGGSSDPGSSDPGNGDPGNANAGTTNTNEGQGGSINIDNGNGGTPGNPGDPSGAGAGGTEATPAPTGLAPNCNPPEGDAPQLTLELVAEGLNEPLYVTSAPGDDSRLFIVEKDGLVRVLVDGQLQQTPFINVPVPTGPQDFERGLLGMAFHPNYATNGLFYLHYSSNGSAGLPGNGDTVIAEFRVSENDRSVADAGSRRVVLTIDQPASNHNGGEITFGPDGLLYLGFGDGGNGNDQFGPIGNGQNLNTRLGKILRIDPLGRDVENAFSVPAGNLAQVTNQQALPEIWAYGLRNPWRFSFDACTGDLYIGDVGQGAQEEIDFLAANPEGVIAAGANFGWRIMEGSICRPGEANCNAQTQASLILPIDSYARMIGTSVTGGYVYRGSAIPGLRGQYIYADYNSARFFRFRVQNGQLAERTEITTEMRPAGGGNIDNIASFGTDNAGEMYVAAFNPGAVYRVAAAQ